MSGGSHKVTINCKELVQILATNKKKFKKELIHNLCRCVVQKMKVPGQPGM
jgi:hypothetical protein